jgi:hypothetical protein
MLFDWHSTEQEARDAIKACADKLGDQVYKIQTVAYFPDEDAATAAPDPPEAEQYRNR